MVNAKKNFLMMTAALMMVLSFTACSDDDGLPTASVADRETLYQTALLQSLMQGYYDGSVSIANVKRHGDIGIGTFDRVNGEMIVLDGVVYQALWDGTVEVADNQLTTPFCNVTYFDVDVEQSLTYVESLSQLSTVLTTLLPNPNHFCMARIDGVMQYILVRSELPQRKPYRPLADALITDQREYEYENLSGTIVALYCPKQVGMLNTPGWHFHFISDDRMSGGHVLEVKTRLLNCKLDETPYFRMEMPEDVSFGQLDLSKDMSDDIESVEK